MAARHRAQPQTQPPQPMTPAGAAGAAAARPPAASTAPLRIPSDLAFGALLLLPLAFWAAALAAGMALHDGVPTKAQRAAIDHPLQWFDSAVLARFGNLLPFGMLALRMAACALPLSGDARRAGGGKAAAGGGGGAPARAATLARIAAAAYGALAALRIGVYLAHGAAHGHGAVAHLISDHITLGACLVACLQLEALCALSDVLRHHERADERCSADGVREFALVAVLVANLCLLLLVAADAFFTALIYHAVAESAATAALGLAAFQGPALALARRYRLR